MPTRVEAIEHSGQDSLRRMVEWVVDLRLHGLVPPCTEFSAVFDENRSVGRLSVGPGAEALISEGGHLVFLPAPRGGPGLLEVVDADRFHRDFRPLS